MGQDAARAPSSRSKGGMISALRLANCGKISVSTPERHVSRGQHGARLSNPLVRAAQPLHHFRGGSAHLHMVRSSSAAARKRNGRRRRTCGRASDRKATRSPSSSLSPMAGTQDAAAGVCLDGKRSESGSLTRHHAWHTACFPCLPRTRSASFRSPCRAPSLPSPCDDVHGRGLGVAWGLSGAAGVRHGARPPCLLTNGGPGQ